MLGTLCTLQTRPTEAAQQRQQVHLHAKCCAHPATSAEWGLGRHTGTLACKMPCAPHRLTLQG